MFITGRVLRAFDGHFQLFAPKHHSISTCKNRLLCTLKSFIMVQNIQTNCFDTYKISRCNYVELKKNHETFNWQNAIFLHHFGGQLRLKSNLHIQDFRNWEVNIGNSHFQCCRVDYFLNYLLSLLNFKTSAVYKVFYHL